MPELTKLLNSSIPLVVAYICCLSVSIPLGIDVFIDFYATVSIYFPNCMIQITHNHQIPGITSVTYPKQRCALLLALFTSSCFFLSFRSNPRIDLIFFLCYYGRNIIFIAIIFSIGNAVVIISLIELKLRLKLFRLSLFRARSEINKSRLCLFRGDYIVDDNLGAQSLFYLLQLDTGYSISCYSHSILQCFARRLFNHLLAPTGTSSTRCASVAIGLAHHRGVLLPPLYTSYLSIRSVCGDLEHLQRGWWRPPAIREHYGALHGLVLLLHHIRDT